MEVGRLELMLRTGILRHARRKGWIPLVAAQTIRYKSPLRRFRRFTLTTHLAGWDDRWFFIEHEIEREGRTMAFGVAKCCFRGREGVVAPAVAFSALGIEGVGRSLPGYVSPWLASEEKLEEVVGGA